MDVGEIRELVRRPSRRSAWVMVGAGLVLAVSLWWSLQQSRLTREAFDRAAAAEQAVSEIRGDRRPAIDMAIRRSAHADRREVDRVEQLQKEIEGLGQLREQVEQSIMTDRIYVPKEIRARR